MGSCGCLSMEEVHQVAYLTMRGWTLTWDQEWTKEGFEMKVEKRQNCGCCTKEETTPYFPLGRAYDAQREKDDEAT